MVEYDFNFHLDDFSSGVLDTFGEFLNLLFAKRVDSSGRLDLGKDRNDCDSGVTSNDGNMDINGVHIAQISDKLVGADDIESGDSIDLKCSI